MVFSPNAPTSYNYGKNVRYRTVSIRDVNFPVHRIRNPHFVELGLPEYEDVQYIRVVDSNIHIPGALHINKIDKNIIKIIRVDFEVDRFRREDRQMRAGIQNDPYCFYYILLEVYPFNNTIKEEFAHKSQFILRTNPLFIFTTADAPEHVYEFIPLNEFSSVEDATSTREHHDINHNFINHIFYNWTGNQENNYRQFMKIQKEIVATLLKTAKKALKKDVRGLDVFIERNLKDLEEKGDRWGFVGKHVTNLREAKARGTLKLQKLKGRSESSSSSSSREYAMKEKDITEEQINKLKRGLLVGGK